MGEAAIAPLDRLRLLVMRDAALQARLARAGPEFAACATDAASAHGIALSPDAFGEALRPDPLGIGCWAVPPVMGRDWPGADWLPVDVPVSGGEASVDWSYFGGAPLRDAFFEGALRRALGNPFNRVFRYRMTLGDFVAAAKRADAPPPTGFIFHMSRCGSTLVSQMLAALPDMSVISEASPVDAMARVCRLSRALSGNDAARCLSAVVSAFTRNAGRTVLKMSAWNALMMPAFRRAFPDTPWLFLYREPEEVLVSLLRERGAETRPEIVAPEFLGIAEPAAADEAYCAQVLEKICAAAVAQHASGGGRFIAYRDLPGAVARAVLPHFAIAPRSRDLDALAAAARVDPKAGGIFTGDRNLKRAATTGAIRAAAARYVSGVHAQLESLRAD